MSFESILIHRDLPIIGKYVQLPPNEEANKSALLDADAETLLSANFVQNQGLTIQSLFLGSGRQTGAKHGAQSFLRLPGIRPDEWYENLSGSPSDPVEVLKS